MALKTANVMVVTPHPDDAEYGVAGSVAQWVKKGRSVIYIVCTNGDKGTSDRKIKPEELVKTREQEQRNAARVLGVKEVIFLDYHDQYLEDTPHFRKQLVRLIRTYKPETVVTVDPYLRYFWWHRDHRACGQVVMDAIFPYGRDHLAYADLLEQGLEPHKVRELLLFNTGDPNYRIDISDTFSQKVEALRCHKSQVASFAAELEVRLRDWARQMAQEEEFELAEAFHRIDIWW
ncbi:MAG: PIG-L family deacetylase [Dehalococcoidia bacterium]|nr:MAG: PIG-L family deacetylase [Dehalococcoidia bacterium]